MKSLSLPTTAAASTETHEIKMANPRKFSEKIALHNQKQAEETAAFEEIMREVMGATRVKFFPPLPTTTTTTTSQNFVKKSCQKTPQIVREKFSLSSFICLCLKCCWLAIIAQAREWERERELNLNLATWLLCRILLACEWILVSESWTFTRFVSSLSTVKIDCLSVYYPISHPATLGP